MFLLSNSGLKFLKAGLNILTSSSSSGLSKSRLNILKAWLNFLTSSSSFLSSGLSNDGLIQKVQ